MYLGGFLGILIDSALTDFKIWYPKLRPGGMLGGDDYMDSAQHGTAFDATKVKSALRDFLKSVRGADTEQQVQIDVLHFGTQFALIKPYTSPATLSNDN